MAIIPGRARRLLLPMQLAVTSSLAVMVALVPPARGAMLLVPLPGAVPAIAPALASGAALAGAGPIAGSLRVAGERDRLLWPLLRRGILTLSTAPVGCGSDRA